MLIKHGNLEINFEYRSIKNSDLYLYKTTIINDPWTVFNSPTYYDNLKGIANLSSINSFIENPCNNTFEKMHSFSKNSRFYVYEPEALKKLQQNSISFSKFKDFTCPLKEKFDKHYENENLSIYQVLYHTFNEEFVENILFSLNQECLWFDTTLSFNTEQFSHISNIQDQTKLFFQQNPFKENFCDLSSDNLKDGQYELTFNHSSPLLYEETFAILSEFSNKYDKQGNLKPHDKTSLISRYTTPDNLKLISLLINIKEKETTLNLNEIIKNFWSIEENDIHTSRRAKHLSILIFSHHLQKQLEHKNTKQSRFKL